MTQHSFSLIPFPDPNIPNIVITGSIVLQKNLLRLHYSLTGKIEEVALPSLSLDPRRKDELWKTTCFEFFLARRDQAEYWEFNLSPSGDWNVYHMDAYRRVGFREETLIPGLQLDVRKDTTALSLKTVVDVNFVLKSGLSSQIFEAGISAVIQMKNGHETYWALTHPAPLVDFHTRESFTLALAGQTRLLGQSALGD